MKTILMIAVCLSGVLLGGCNRCDMWDWYPPCDLIEGRAARECCPQPCYKEGQVVKTEWAVPAQPCQAPGPAPVDAAVPADPLPPPTVVDATVIDAPPPAE